MACGENYYWWSCDKCGNAFKVHVTCKRRTCLKCAGIRSRQLVEMYLPVVSTFKWPCFITFTLKVDFLKTAKEQVDKIIASFRKLRQRKVWDAKRGLFGIEMVKKEEAWYIHLHGLIDSKWMDHDALSSAWFKITGDSYVVYLKRISDRRGALREVLKYQTKIWELSEEDKEFVEETFEHRRFVNAFGIKKPKKLEPKPMKCKICGGNLTKMDDEIYQAQRRHKNHPTPEREFWDDG